ncbi:hypothetical protein X777_12384, partial [Ooceraea biroi]
GDSNRNVRTELNICRMHEEVNRFTENNNPSIHDVSRELGISHTSVHRILKSDLHYRGYHFQPRQPLKETDYARRVEMARIFLQAEDPQFFDRVLLTDEAKFNLSGAVNVHNCIFWTGRNPHMEYESSSTFMVLWSGLVYGQVAKSGYIFLKVGSVEHRTLKCFKHTLFQDFQSKRGCGSNKITHLLIRKTMCVVILMHTFLVDGSG